MPLLAECCSIVYMHGSRESHWSDKTGFSDSIQSSKLILHVEVRGRMYQFWIDHFFKKNWGRLTHRRRDALRATMPAHIAVSEHRSPRGYVYYKPLDSALADWLAKARSHKA